jgi:hypothetical protein
MNSIQFDTRCQLQQQINTIVATSAEGDHATDFHPVYYEIELSKEFDL